ncbi:MAG: hypothetical protein NTZ05_06570 [Chloroflexi bacterium]|nr:hypothetical protein [Chloroflexota bacterium]
MRTVDQLAQLGVQTSLVAAIVWAVVQVIKPWLAGRDPRALALLMSVVLGAVIGYGLIPPQVINAVGGIVLTSLGANFLHDKVYSSSDPSPGEAGSSK